MADVDLDALEQAVAKMIPGPWTPDGTWPTATLSGPTGDGSYRQAWSVDNNVGIAALRNAAPSLIAELRRLRGQTCETCKYMAIAPDGTEWCCVAPDGVGPEDINAGTVGVANWLCAVVGGRCGAHEPKVTP